MNNNADMKYIQRFDNNDTIALAIIRDGKTEQRFIRAGDYQKYRGWLRYKNSQGYNVYCSVATLTAGTKNRKKDSFLDNQSVVWIELDFKTQQWSKFHTDLPFPSLIVASSINKTHLYWLLSDKVNKNDIENINQGLRHYFEGKYGQNVDTVHDISRVLRIPGYKNHKNGYYCRLLQSNFKRYSPDIFSPLVKLLPETGTVSHPVINNSVSNFVKPSFESKSKSESDMREVIYRLTRLNWSRDQTINYLISKRAGEKSDINYYAELTVSKAISYINSRR